MTQHFTLPDRLDSTAAPALAVALLDRRGQPLTVDASGVEVLGTLAIEVIVAAGRQWTLDGHGLAIAAPSARFRAACESLGLAVTAPWTVAAGQLA